MENQTNIDHPTIQPASLDQNVIPQPPVPFPKPKSKFWLIFSLILLFLLLSVSAFILIKKTPTTPPATSQKPTPQIASPTPNVTLETGFSFYLPLDWSAKISDQSKQHFFGKFFFPEAKDSENTYVEIESIASNKYVSNPFLKTEKTNQQTINNLTADITEGTENFGTSDRQIKQVIIKNNQNNSLIITLYKNPSDQTPSSFDTLIQSITASGKQSHNGFQIINIAFAAENISCTADPDCTATQKCNSSGSCEEIICPLIPPEECKTRTAQPHSCGKEENQPNGTSCESDTGQAGTCQNGTCLVPGSSVAPTISGPNPSQIAGFDKNLFILIPVMGDPLPDRITKSNSVYKDGYAKFYQFQGLKGQRLTTVAMEDQTTNPHSFIRTELYDEMGNSLDQKDTRVEFDAPYTGIYYLIVRSFNNQEGGYLFKIFDRNQTENLIYLKYADGSERLLDPTKSPPSYGEKEVAIIFQFISPVEVIDNNTVRYFAKPKEFEKGLGLITTPIETFLKPETYHDFLQPGHPLPEENRGYLTSKKITQLSPSKILIEPEAGKLFPKNNHIVITEMNIGRYRFFTENPAPN